MTPQELEQERKVYAAYGREKEYDKMKEEELLDQTFGTYDDANSVPMPPEPVKGNIVDFLEVNLAEVIIAILALILLFGVYGLYNQKTNPKPAKVVEEVDSKFYLKKNEIKSDKTVDVKLVEPRFYIESCADGVTLLIVEPPYHSSTATVLYKRDINDKLVACNLK